MYQIKMNNPVVLIVFAILWLMEIYNCNDNYYQRTFRGMFWLFHGRIQWNVTYS